MKKCINFNHPDVINLADQLSVKPILAATKISVWQKNNNTDEFPSIDDLAISIKSDKPVNKKDTLNEGQKNAVEKLEKFTQKNSSLFVTNVFGETATLETPEQIADYFKNEFLNESEKIELMKEYIIQNGFLLTGAAGTGKTYTSEIAVSNVPRLVYAAPTYQAASILKRNTKAEDVKTIASLLGTGMLDKSVTDSNSDDFYLEDIKEIKAKLDLKGTPPPVIFTAENILIDEASMIGGNGKLPTKRFETVMKIKKEVLISNDSFVAMALRLVERLEEFGTLPERFIFLGDYVQTAPVGTSGDSDAELLEKLMANEDQFSNLTQIMRTDDEQIKSLLQAYRDEVDRLIELRNDEKITSELLQARANVLPVPINERVNSENIHYYKDHGDFVDQFIHLYKNRDEKSKYDADYVALVNYNSSVHANTVAMVNKIRTALFGDTETKYHAGETLLCKDKITVRNEQAKKTEELDKDTRIFVNSVEEGISQGELGKGKNAVSFKIKVPRLTITYNNNQEATIFAASEEYVRHIKNITNGGRYDKEKKGIRLEQEEIDFFGLSIRNNILPYGAWTELRKLIPDFGYGYVVNNFKVQGSSLQYVMVDESNLLTAPVNPKKKLQYIYTALSRGRYKIFIYNLMNRINSETNINPVAIAEKNETEDIEYENNTNEIKKPNVLNKTDTLKQKAISVLANTVVEKDKSSFVGNVVGENITSKGSEFAKKLTNVGNSIGLIYKGKEYINSEHAYQTWKSGEFNQAGYDLKGGKVRGGKIGDTFSIMTDILTEKLKQNPELVQGINERGGLEYLQKSTHDVIGDKFWESTGQNKFIEALILGYKNSNNTQNTSKLETLNLPGKINYIKQFIKNSGYGFILGSEQDDLTIRKVLADNNLDNITNELPNLEC